MAYSPPSLQIFQEFQSVLQGSSVPLSACILAPQFALHRYIETDEKALLAAYDVVSGNTSAVWPDRHAATSTVDLTSAKIFMEDATVQYLQLNLSGTIVSGARDGLLTSGANKIRSHAYTFKTGNGHARSTALGTRDVAIGDKAIVTYGATTINTTVAGFDHETEAATTGTATAGTANKAATTVAAVVTESIASTDFTVTASAAAYDGLGAGYPSDTYVCTVIATDGTIPGTTVRIASASGTDNVTSQLLGTGAAVALGARGAVFTIVDIKDSYSSSSSSSNSDSSSSSSSHSEESSASDNSSSSSDNKDRVLVTGDSWSVAVSQTYAKPTPTAGGTFTGTQDTTYLVSITAGGTIGTDTVKFIATTIDGYDAGIEVEMTAAGAYSAGNYGITFTVAGAAKYVTGDAWTIAVTAASDGAYKTLILAANLTGALTNTPLAVVLALEDTFELDDSQWTATASLITVAAGALHSAAYLGTTAMFDILAGDIYVEYRELILDCTTEVSALTAIEDVEPTLGPVHPDNPLALLVYAALSKSNGTAVYYVGVTEETATAYTAACELLTEVQEVYSLVPYNTSSAIRTAVEAHVTSMSAPATALFRIAWFGIDEDREFAWYTAKTTGGNIVASVTGTALSAAGGEFSTKLVRAGDRVRINYQPDGMGGTTYDTYVVAAVVSDTALTLVAGPATPISTPVKMEVWRYSTLAEYAANIYAWAVASADRRVRAVWCDTLEWMDFTDLSKTVLCAMLAGMRSYAAPHQPLTNVSITNVSITNSTNFGSTLLNTMAGNGVWLVVRDVSGNVFTRHQLTTDPTDINTKEDTITCNLDHICRDFKDGVQDLYGRGNVSQAMLELIRSRVYSINDRITARSYPDTIGPQLQDLTITRLAVDPVLRDQVWLELEPVLPYPMNNLTVKFRIL